MEFKEDENAFTGEKHYTIKIIYGDDVEPFDIAECFKAQYPKKICVLTYAKVIQMECGLMIMGMKLLNSEGSRNG